MTFILNDKRLLQLNDWFLYKESDEKTVKKMYKCGSITQECILVQHADKISNLQMYFFFQVMIRHQTFIYKSSVMANKSTKPVYGLYSIDCRYCFGQTIWYLWGRRFLSYNFLSISSGQVCYTEQRLQSSCSKISRNSNLSNFCFRTRKYRIKHIHQIIPRLVIPISIGINQSVVTSW
jgi:hypothetical protein